MNRIEDFTKIVAPTAIFRVYNETQFMELKTAACNLWGKIDQNYQITDEFFTNLSTVNCTIQQFYKGGYVPLNQEGHAIVYLFQANQRQTQLN